MGILDSPWRQIIGSRYVNITQTSKICLKFAIAGIFSEIFRLSAFNHLYCPMMGFITELQRKNELKHFLAKLTNSFKFCTSQFF